MDMPLLFYIGISDSFLALRQLSLICCLVHLLIKKLFVHQGFEVCGVTATVIKGASLLKTDDRVELK